MFLNPIIPVWIMIIICPILVSILLAILFGQKRNLIEKIIRAIRITLIIAIIFVINLRPMISAQGGEVMLSNVNVLFVIDNTLSMLAEDYNGDSTRLSAVKNDVAYITEELSGASFAVISFDNSSKILSPFTADVETIDDVVSILNSINYIYAKGSSLNFPKEDMETLLKSASKKTDKRTICFFLSDGEITNDSKLQSYKSLAQYLSGGAVLGYGTEKGGKIRTSDEYDLFVKDPDSLEDAISKLDEKNLKKIAEDLNIEYVRMDRQSNIDKVLKPIKKAQVKEASASKKNSGKDTYYYFVIPLVILLLWEFIDFRRRV